MKLRLFILFSLLPLMLFGQMYKSHTTTNNKLSIHTSEGLLNLIPLSDNAIRVQLTVGSVFEPQELIFTNQPFRVDFKTTENETTLLLTTQRIVVSINKQNGQLTFADNSGKVFLTEKAGPRKLTFNNVMGEPCFEAEQSFESPDDEQLYGLGQFQDGNFNLKGIARRLTQVNSQIALPFVYSNKGYGLLWHQYGLTDFNPADNFINLEKQAGTSSGNNQMAEVTTTSGTQKVSQDQSVYLGKFTVPQNGMYSIFLNLGDMGNRQLVVIDGRPCIDQTNWWLPPTAGTIVNLNAGEHNVQVVCKASNIPKLSWKQYDNLTTFRSPHAKMLDYVVFYGPSSDSVIATYRNLSGNVSMLPLWAFGFWQCRERYTSGSQLIETVKEFRKRNLPMDVIVQDWQYWGNNGWGVPEFDSVNYANPAGFIKNIHDLHAHFNISIWSNPDRNSTLGKTFITKNLYIPDSKWLDYFKPETRKEYWNTLKTNLFNYGVDSWWMDATEPENDALRGQKTYLGVGDFYRLTYPLMVCKAVYEGQRESNYDKRVCILTRSAFLGQQRYGTINWSGDIGSTWDSYKRQIVAGLNYTITGMPYWTTDIGGFFRPGNSQYTDEKYHELLIRWFQWGAFNPIFRIHGYQTETEPWKYGSVVEDNMHKVLELRYCLLPYIYSEAWQVTKNGYTLMRPLVMDFREDAKATNQLYEFMFGKSIMVAPITDPGVNQRDVYLPQSSNWYNFWTGNYYEGGQTIKTEAPLDIIPLFVKAGSILPIGKNIQYTGEKSADTIEIRIYKGAHGQFDLYEDENDNYNYEKGAYATIIFSWNDNKKELTIGERNGSFPGMIKERKFNIVLVGKNKGTGCSLTEKFGKVVNYSGKKVEVKL